MVVPFVRALIWPITPSKAAMRVFDGISRHIPEGLDFKARSESEGWKDWVENQG